MVEQEKQPDAVESKDVKEPATVVSPEKSDKTAEKTAQNPKSDEEVHEDGPTKRQKISETEAKVVKPKDQEEEKKEPASKKDLADDSEDFDGEDDGKDDSFDEDFDAAEESEPHGDDDDFDVEAYLKWR